MPANLIPLVTNSGRIFASSNKATPGKHTQFIHHSYYFIKINPISIVSAVLNN